MFKFRMAGIAVLSVVALVLAAFAACIAPASAGVCGKGTYSAGQGPKAPGDASTCPTTTVVTLAPPVSIVADPAPVDPCEEDEPCWDCETMGNGICGPIAPPVNYEPGPRVETDPELVQPVAATLPATE